MIDWIGKLGWTKQADKPAGPENLPRPGTRAFSVKEVIAREKQQIHSLSDARNVRDRLNPPSNLDVPAAEVPSPKPAPAPEAASAWQAPEQFGVCFSGGGVRSASVNLGLIQAMAKSGFLRQVHYASGVSGGGYILGFLSAWIARVGFDAVESQLSADSAWPKNQLPERPGFRRFLEPNPIHYLRRYVSYLIPRSGLGSGDTLAAGAIYLRNLLLIQLNAWLALVTVLALLQLSAPSLLWHLLGQWCNPALLGILCVFLLAALAVVTGYALDQLARDEESEWRSRWATLARISGFLVCVVAWLYLPQLPRTASVLAGHVPLLHVSQASYTWLFSAVLVFLLFGVQTAVQMAHGRDQELKGVNPGSRGWAWLLAASGAAAVTALFVFLLCRWFLPGDVVSDWYAVLGLPVLLLAGCLISFFHIGLLGNSMPDAKREWLGRLAGYFLFFAVIAAVTLSVALLGPLAMNWLFHVTSTTWKTTLLKWILPGGWIATTIGGLFAARSPKTGGDSNRALELLANVAPPVFLLGVMLLGSWSIHGLARLGAGEYLTTGTTVTAKPVQQPGCCQIPAAIPRFKVNALTSGAPTPPWTALQLIAIFVGCWSLTVVVSLRLSVNEFSLHLFYRNRLVRTFLGASNIDPKTQVTKRKPDPFTGFNLDDDRYLGSLRRWDALRERLYDGPYPLWCAALNLTAGEDLAWQQRKAASFLYSPMFCGWDYLPTRSSRHKAAAYREVAACFDDGASNGEGYGGRYGAPLIGTAMAASGAAISPNWGFHTKPAIAALLTLFNVRIGWWTGNPHRQDSYQEYSPSPWYLLSELLGMANEDSRFVYLSDGGHFENLGIYELVRRRVKYIIACDADADPNYEFGDLSNALEKCRIDFGVQIELTDFTEIKPKKTGMSSLHFAIGMIHYRAETADEARNGVAPGILLYLKSSLTGDEPGQVLGQRTAGAAFPHDTTLNQFFNENQFEAYRELGEHMAGCIFDEYLNSKRPKGGLGDLTRELRAAMVREFFEVFLRSKFDAAGVYAGKCKSR